MEFEWIKKDKIFVHASYPGILIIPQNRKLRHDIQILMMTRTVCGARAMKQTESAKNQSRAARTNVSNRRDNTVGPVTRLPGDAVVAQSDDDDELKRAGMPLWPSLGNQKERALLRNVLRGRRNPAVQNDRKYGIFSIGGTTGVANEGTTETFKCCQGVQLRHETLNFYNKVDFLCRGVDYNELCDC